MSLPLLHAGRTNPGLSAALDLRFALDKSLTAYRGPTPSFSRASTGSYFDGSGVLRYATVNLFTYSDDFSEGSWTKANSATIIVNNAIAPNGTLTADRMTAASNISSVYKTMTVESGRTYSFSVFAKAGNFSKIVMEHRQSGINVDAVFDLSNGTLVSGSGVITDFGNGWYRCSISEATVDTSDLFIIGFESTATNGSYVYLWGAQLEASSTVGTYCPTTSSANSAPRFDHTYNGTSWVSRGLLVEEQRTNVLTYSNTFSNGVWTKVRGTVSQDVVGPDGATSGWTATCNETGGGHYAYITPGSGASTSGAYTISVFAKKGNNGLISLQMSDTSFANYVTSYFDLTAGTATTPSITGNYSAASAKIENVGSGWYRCSLTATKGSSNGITASVGFSNDSTAGYCTSGQYNYFYNSQLEFGAFPTSAIVTTSAQTTRSADVCQITGTDFSGFYNQNEGSVVLEFDGAQPLPSPSPRNFPTYVTISKGNSGYDLETNSFTIFGNSDTNKIGAYASIDRATQYEIYSTGLFSPNMTQRSSFGYAVNNFGFTNNGENVLTDTSGTNPNQMAYLHLGKSSGGTFSCHIARLRYFNKRLPNATLQLLSEPDPTLNLQFALNKSLTPVAGPAPSFSRASTGTYFNASGVLTSASINTPRFDHVYSGGQWVSRGLLVEEQRTNLTTHSSDLSHADWGKFDASITTDQATAPDGTNTADFIKEGTGSVYKIASPYYAVSAGKYTFSAYLKAGTRTFAALSLRVNNAASGASGTFDLTNGTFIRQVNDGSPTGFSYTITNVGNGWYRYSVSLDHTSGNVYAYIALSNASFPSGGYGITLPYYVGDGTSGIYAWGAQFEAGAFPTSYIGTTNSSVVRSADVCQITGTSFNWMWNQGEGSVVAEWDRIGNYPATEQAVFSASNGSNAELIYYTSWSNFEYVKVFDNSVAQADLSSTPIQPPNTPLKMATAYKANDFALSKFGGSVITDNSGTVPTPDRFDFGARNGGIILNGHIAQLIYYPARLTNTKLQHLST